ncbi:pitrilysin family protein [Petrotoga sp. 9PWA.NaAc.5.4]|uniref:M16 family metallopeptidase n=1 Tax=Petrotoga sp. 9PWA.NaAc.5.4 TaxID=1434328 RepID=UPI000CADC073|nr:pitrilysin family protein [Petrotoga sp. 9PWA.NaAc.5.4]PNR95405.1 hypothetical protein X924_05040 [Petrotoga sp. 9PWA.NaAc.5.4]
MYKYKKLDNGLNVILVSRESMMSAAVLFCVKAGSSKESSNDAGIFHLIEHLVFRGTKKRDAHQIKNPIEEVGGTLNAFTSKNFTVFYTKVPAIKVTESIEILSEIVFEPLFKTEDIIKEKNIVSEEISSYEDDPINNVFENLYKNIYDEGFARPVLGFKETVSNLNYDVIDYYYKTFYIPENVDVIIVGKFVEDDVLNQLNKINPTNDSRLKIDISSPIIKNENVVIKKAKKDLSSSYVVRAFKASGKITQGYYNTLILNTFLGSGMSSLLFSKLRDEEGLVYEVASDYEAYPKEGLLLFFAATSEEKLSILIKKFQEIFSIIKDYKKMEKWFNYGKNRLIGKLTLELENNLSMALNILDLYENYGKIITIEEFIEKLEKVKMEDVIETTENILLSPEFISILSPQR